MAGRSARHTSYLLAGTKYEGLVPDVPVDMDSLMTLASNTRGTSAVAKVESMSLRYGRLVSRLMRAAVEGKDPYESIMEWQSAPPSDITELDRTSLPAGLVSRLDAHAVAVKQRRSGGMSHIYKQAESTARKQLGSIESSIAKAEQAHAARVKTRKQMRSSKFESSITAPGTELDYSIDLPGDDLDPGAAGKGKKLRARPLLREDPTYYRVVQQLCRTNLQAADGLGASELGVLRSLGELDRIKFRDRVSDKLLGRARRFARYIRKVRRRFERNRVFGPRANAARVSSMVEVSIMSAHGAVSVHRARSDVLQEIGDETAFLEALGGPERKRALEQALDEVFRDTKWEGLTGVGTARLQGSSLENVRLSRTRRAHAAVEHFLGILKDKADERKAAQAVEHAREQQSATASRRASAVVNALQSALHQRLAQVPAEHDVEQLLGGGGGGGGSDAAIKESPGGRGGRAEGGRRVHAGGRSFRLDAGASGRGFGSLEGKGEGDSDGGLMRRGGKSRFPRTVDPDHRSQPLWINSGRMDRFDRLQSRLWAQEHGLVDEASALMTTLPPEMRRIVGTHLPRKADEAGGEMIRIAGGRAGAGMGMGMGMEGAHGRERSGSTNGGHASLEGDKLLVPGKSDHEYDSGSNAAAVASPSVVTAPVDWNGPVRASTSLSSKHRADRAAFDFVGPAFAGQYRPTRAAGAAAIRAEERTGNKSRVGQSDSSAELGADVESGSRYRHTYDGRGRNRRGSMPFEVVERRRNISVGSTSGSASGSASASASKSSSPRLFEDIAAPGSDDSTSDTGTDSGSDSFDLHRPATGSGPGHREYSGSNATQMQGKGGTHVRQHIAPVSRWSGSIGISPMYRTRDKAVGAESVSPTDDSLDVGAASMRATGNGSFQPAQDPDEPLMDFEDRLIASLPAVEDPSSVYDATKTAFEQLPPIAGPRRRRAVEALRTRIRGAYYGPAEEATLVEVQSAVVASELMAGILRRGHTDSPSKGRRIDLERSRGLAASSDTQGGKGAIGAKALIDLAKGSKGNLYALDRGGSTSGARFDVTTHMGESLLGLEEDAVSGGLDRLAEGNPEVETGGGISSSRLAVTRAEARNFHETDEFLPLLQVKAFGSGMPRNSQKKPHNVIAPTFDAIATSTFGYIGTIVAGRAPDGTAAEILEIAQRTRRELKQLEREGRTKGRRVAPGGTLQALHEVKEGAETLRLEREKYAAGASGLKARLAQTKAKLAQELVKSSAGTNLAPLPPASGGAASGLRVTTPTASKRLASPHNRGRSRAPGLKPETLGASVKARETLSATGLRQAAAGRLMTPRDREERNRLGPRWFEHQGGTPNGLYHDTRGTDRLGDVKLPDRTSAATLGSGGAGAAAVRRLRVNSAGPFFQGAPSGSGFSPVAGNERRADTPVMRGGRDGDDTTRPVSASQSHDDRSGDGIGIGSTEQDEAAVATERRNEAIAKMQRQGSFRIRPKSELQIELEASLHEDADQGHDYVQQAHDRDATCVASPLPPPGTIGRASDERQTPSQDPHADHPRPRDDTDGLRADVDSVGRHSMATDSLASSASAALLGLSVRGTRRAGRRSRRQRGGAGDTGRKPRLKRAAASLAVLEARRDMSGRLPLRRGTRILVGRGDPRAMDPSSGLRPLRVPEPVEQPLTRTQLLSARKMQQKERIRYMETEAREMTKAREHPVDDESKGASG